MGKSTILKLVESYGNCRSVETVEKRTACFSTVPTSLGKLGKKRAEFPTVPTAPATKGYISTEGKKRGKRFSFAGSSFKQPDMSPAIKSGHFNLLRTDSGSGGIIECCSSDKLRPRPNREERVSRKEAKIGAKPQSRPED